ISKLPGDVKVRLRHHWDVLDIEPDSQGEFELDIARLGTGPVRLQPVACDSEGKVLYGGLPVKVFVED
ncbi:MAG: hypothetical protein ACKOAU_00425, partial [Pirellula sp.]